MTMLGMGSSPILARNGQTDPPLVALIDQKY